MGQDHNIDKRYEEGMLNIFTGKHVDIDEVVSISYLHPYFGSYKYEQLNVNSHIEVFLHPLKIAYVISSSYSCYSAHV